MNHASDAHARASLNRSAFSATTHCLTGCAIGEVLGMVIATALGWGNTASIAISIVLAFFFGYALTLGPVLRAGVPLRRALPLGFASDTASITVMEIVDNAFILLVPGAIRAGLLVEPGAKSRNRLCFRVPAQPVADRAGTRSRRASRVPRSLAVRDASRSALSVRQLRASEGHIQRS
jgi:hypothetical protein